MLDKFLSFLKVLLIVILVLLFCALVWWGGPELRIGDSRPLEPVGWRLFVLALPLLIYLIPLTIRFYKWMWQRLETTQTVPEPELMLQSCHQALKTIKVKLSESQGLLASLKYFFSGPDIILTGDEASLAHLLAKWPYPVLWDSGETEVGRYFFSNGLVWLHIPNDAWKDWSKAMRWKQNPRSLVWLVDSKDWKEVSIRSDLIKTFQVKLLAWQKHSLRSLPYWLYFADLHSEHGPLAWTSNEATVPYGFSLTVSVKFNSFNWKNLSHEFLNSMQAAVVKPNLSIAAAQAKLTCYFECQRVIEDARSSLGHLPNLRGVFWIWSGSHQLLIGWKGFLRIVQKDFALGVLRPDVSFLSKFSLGLFSIALMLIFVDQTFFRIDRHTQAFNEWFRQSPTIHRQFVQVSEDTDQIRPVLISLESLETLGADSQDVLGETLNELAKQAIADHQSNLVRNHLTPRLYKINLACIQDNPAVDADKLFQATRFLVMLYQPINSDLLLMKRWLEECKINSDQADLALLFWKRYAATQTQHSKQLALWRSQLNSQFAYSVSQHIWSRVVSSASGSNVKNFNLQDALGPTATWFSNNEEVPMLFTAQGYVNGFLPAQKLFPQWVNEYQWVMGFERKTLTRNEWESLKALSSSRYVESAIQSWDRWFAGLHLNRVDGVLQAADRANLFGSEDSPITLLLSVLEENIPLPQTKSVHFLDRVKTRVSDDWAHLQYQLGWRANARASMNPNDPRRAIGQHFVVLRRFFPDKNGKSTERERLLSSITQIGQYLIQSDASAEMGVKTASSSTLKRIQIQAAQLPKPLKEIIYALISNSEGELQKNTDENFVMEMRNISTFSMCQNSARFPLYLQARDELPWRDFVEDFSNQGKISKFINAQTSLIDTTQSPWKFKSTSGARQISTADLRWLERASKISKSWFSDKSAEFTFFIRPVSLQSNVRVARIRFDDQYWTYSHGQQFAQKFLWSSNGNLPTIEMELIDVDGKSSKFQATGPWALLRWAQSATQETSKDPFKVLLDFQTEVGRMQLEVSTLETLNPLSMKLYDQWCS